jgi:NitT/TauT family transport system ATP-binding protein
MALMDGKPVIKPGPDRAVLFQNAALFPWLPVIENVEFGLRIKGIGRLDRKRTAEKYLQIVGMERYAKAYVHELSGGMKQRVDLARALALGSRMLIMDEPFAALDPHSRCEMQDELLRIWKETGKTILFVTHSVDEAIYLADRIIIMTGSPGKIRRIQNVDTERPRRRDDLQFINQLADIMQDIKGGMTGVADVAYTVNATLGNGIIQDIK